MKIQFWSAVVSRPFEKQGLIVTDEYANDGARCFQHYAQGKSAARESSHITFSAILLTACETILRAVYTAVKAPVRSTQYLFMMHRSVTASFY